MDILKRIYEYEPLLVNKILNYYYVYRFNDVIKNIKTTKINTEEDLKVFWNDTKFTYGLFGTDEDEFVEQPNNIYYNDWVRENKIVGMGGIYFFEYYNYMRYVKGISVAQQKINNYDNWETKTEEKNNIIQPWWPAGLTLNL